MAVCHFPKKSKPTLYRGCKQSKNDWLNVSFTSFWSHLDISERMQTVLRGVPENIHKVLYYTTITFGILNFYNFLKKQVSACFKIPSLCLRISLLITHSHIHKHTNQYNKFQKFIELIGVKAEYIICTTTIILSCYINILTCNVHKKKIYIYTWQLNQF